MDAADASSESGSDSDAGRVVLVRARHGERRSRGSVVYLEPLDDVIEESSGSDEEGEETAMPVASGASQGLTRARAPTKVPDVPAFRSLKHQHPHHDGQPILPHGLSKGSITPLQLFEQVFTDEILSVVVQNTNKYADSRRQADGSGRAWKGVTLRDLKVWIAITILIGVARARCLPEFWSTDERMGVFKAAKFMSLSLFKQIKRYLHISDPSDAGGVWYSKVEPLASHCRAAFKQLYVPGSDVAVDEMIARFSGRSRHTFRIKGKPTPEGYKILALCEHGYTYDFLFESRVDRTPEAEHVPGLNRMGQQVWQLVRGLPPHQAYNVYMDNYFSSIPLFKHLRDNNIGACGTVRINSPKFPSVLKVPKNARLDWNTTSGRVVDGVLAVLWIDNAPVTMLTTIHELKGDEWTVERKRRRPRETSTNAATVRRVFGDEPTKVLGIPKVIDDYNHKMNGVDIADQLRSYRSLQQSSRRTWFPLFFWLLDTTLVNLSLLHAKLGHSSSKKEFRVSLAWDIIRATTEGEPRRRTRSLGGEPDLPETPKRKRKRPYYVTKGFALPESRFLPGAHVAEYRPERQACAWCRYRAQHGEFKVDNRNPSQTNLYCHACNVPLCCNKHRPTCFFDFHVKQK